MAYKEEIKKFVVDGYKYAHSISTFETDSKHNFVLKNRKDNFITLPPKGFKYHRWAKS